jgi:hypothetical protein
MAISYRPYEPQQEMLLPASLQDWLPKGHLAYFISDTVDALDLRRSTPATQAAARATSRSTRP